MVRFSTRKRPQIPGTNRQGSRPSARRSRNSFRSCKKVTIRLDRQVLNWFKAKGPGYQTRINALLRAYMEAHKA
ncbi:MAG: hypothetical protein CV088_19960 [Nitrospira sp. LK70]|nr:hypothetical protein [Nitrospira sp. LK70]